MMICASFGEQKISPSRSSSRDRALKLSMVPFSYGLEQALDDSCFDGAEARCVMVSSRDS
jgi:hypothetical protein